MIQLPVSDPGRPDTRSPARLLLWIGRFQLGTLAAGIVFGVIWMVAQALMPYAIGRAIQDGLIDDRPGQLALWAGLLLALGTLQAAAGVIRHRFAVLNWLQASFRLIQVVGHHAARAGPAVRGKLSTPSSCSRPPSFSDWSSSSACRCSYSRWGR
jgi:ABC-type multidrug transport system fused ATPase/permease subunit